MHVKFPYGRLALVVAVALLTWGVLSLQALVKPKDAALPPAQPQVRASKIHDYLGAGIGMGALERWQACKSRPTQELAPRGWEQPNGPEGLNTPLANIRFIGWDRVGERTRVGGEGVSWTWLPCGSAKKPNAPPMAS